MWRKSQSSVKPNAVEVDEASGVVYVHRNIAEVEIANEQDKKPVKMFEYEENKVDMDSWETYKTVLNHSDELAEVRDALIEVVGMMEG